MPEIALHTRLRADRIADYERVHQRIPQQLVELFADLGVHQWRIWRHGQELFHLVEVADYQAARAALAEHPVNIAWQREVGEFLDIGDDYSAVDEGLPLVWSLSAQLAEGR